MAKKTKLPKRGGPGQAFRPAPIGWGAVYPESDGMPRPTGHKPVITPTEVPATPFQPAGPLVQRFY